ncbi:MAG: UMP kinase [Planctomycetes bacterium]|nr:UMP kinase [Planctomycetota bacterium]
MNDLKQYRRVLLKVSGESLAHAGHTGIDAEPLLSLAREIMVAAETGTQIAVVVGGGNIVRGATLAAQGIIPKTSADFMGMLGTNINGVALLEALGHLNAPAALLSALRVPRVADPFVRRVALGHLEAGRILILAGGTGNPLCTTDTAAALRAAELECEVILKATKVDGVYTDDPITNPEATRYDSLTYQQAINERLGIMDLTAFSMCMDHEIPILVFDYKIAGHIRDAVSGKRIGTLVHADESGAADQ